MTTAKCYIEDCNSNGTVRRTVDQKHSAFPIIWTYALPADLKPEDKLVIEYSCRACEVRRTQGKNKV